MTQPVQWWYQSDSPPVSIPPTWRRAARNWVRESLPEPAVAGRTMVLYSRKTPPKLSASGFRSDFHGLFSEFHSVLGALVYGCAHRAAAIRVDFRSPLYVEPARGPNWWAYFFESALMPLVDGGPTDQQEIHLNGRFDKYGLHGGFSDIVQGETPYLYPMTYGIHRRQLHELIERHIRLRVGIQQEVARIVDDLFEPAAFVVGVHYRGTDATHGWSGVFSHYRRAPVPYAAYGNEVRRILEQAAPRCFQVFVATDEIDFLTWMRREYGDRVIDYASSPRVPAGSQAVHLNRDPAVSNYQKGASALIDCLILAATHHLVKGRSNLSDASLAFNPDLSYSFWPDVSSPLIRRR
jgi:hypothetical protein